MPVGNAPTGLIGGFIMAKVMSYKASSYYQPAISVGHFCGLNRVRTIAFACRVVDRARNGSNNGFNDQTESGIPNKVKEVFHTLLEKDAPPVPVKLVKFLVRTKPETWAAWEAKARAAGLL